jgi:hypothetical protein
MASPLEVQIILCDAAQADSTGKVHMLGAGWNMTRSPTVHAVALLIGVPWDRANQSLPLKVSLLDPDGRPVQFDTPEGSKPITNEGSIEVGRPPGVAHGSVLNAGFALNVPALPLRPGRYEWRVELAEFTGAKTFTVVG